MEAEACNFIKKRDSIAGVFWHLADYLLFGWRLNTWLDKGWHLSLFYFYYLFFNVFFLLFLYMYIVIFKHRVKTILTNVVFIQTLPSYFKMNIKANACKKLLYRFLEIWAYARGCVTQFCNIDCSPRSIREYLKLPVFRRHIHKALYLHDILKICCSSFS